MTGKRRFRSKRSIGLATLALLATGLWAGPWSPAARADETCFGRTATITGGPNTTITGTEGNDTIVVKGANVIVDGAGGDDRVCVYGADGTVTGGLGDDRVYVSGAGTIGQGGSGDDKVLTDGANGELYGEEGNDTLSLGGAANGYMDGGTEHDKCYGTGANNQIVDCEEINPAEEFNPN